MHPFFDRRPLRSHTKRISYNFDTLALEFELSDVIADYKTKEASHAGASATLHESLHWAQHHGTTVGAFLSCLRYAQHVFARDFSGLKAPVRAAVSEARRKGIPVFTIDPATRTLAAHPVENDTFEGLRVMWYMLNLVYTLYDDQNATLTVTEYAPAAIGVAAHAIGYALAVDLKVSSSAMELDPKKVSEIFGSKEGADLPRTPQGLLTVRSIFEGAAVAAELVLLSLADELDIRPLSDKSDWTHNLHYRLTTGNYSPAFLAFIDVARYRGTMHPLSLASTFAIVCDTALNPPLPPFNWSAPPNRSNWEYREIHPVPRLLKLSRAAGRIGMYRGLFDQQSLERYIDKLCDAANLPSWRWLEHVCHDTPVPFAPDFQKFSPKDVNDAAKRTSYINYVLWVQQKFWRARTEALNNVLLLWAGAGSNNARHGHLDDLDNKKRPRWIQCPVMTLGDHLATNSDPNLAQWLMTSTALHYNLYSYATETGDPRFPGFPGSFVRLPRFVSEAQEMCKEWFGF